MSWGSVEAEDEVRRWLAGLSSDDFGHAQFYVDLLEREGPLLGEPYTRQLRESFVSCVSMWGAIARESRITSLRGAGSSF